MNVARADLGAVAVGRTIFAIGGHVASGVHRVFDDVEAYDTATNAWGRRASMPTPRNNFAVAYARGRIYVMGGLDSWWPMLDVVEVYDPSTDTWTTGARLPVPNGFVAGAAIGDRIYVLGGEAAPGNVLVGVPASQLISVGVRRVVEPLPAGGPVSYAVTVCNTGGSPLSSLEITDTVPAVLASVST
ncbi:MAG: kelch repeat-containing protein, partial [bacterium]